MNMSIPMNMFMGILCIYIYIYIYDCLQISLHWKVILITPFRRDFWKPSECFRNAAFQLAAYGVAYGATYGGRFNCSRSCLRQKPFPQTTKIINICHQNQGWEIH